MRFRETPGLWPIGESCYYLPAALTDTLTVDASYSFTQVAYDGSLGVFPQGRHDDKHSIGLALNLDLSQVREGLGAFARYNYISTASSIALYTSDRHLIAAGLNYRF